MKWTSDFTNSPKYKTVLISHNGQVKLGKQEYNGNWSSNGHNLKTPPELWCPIPERPQYGSINYHLIGDILTGRVSPYQIADAFSYSPEGQGYWNAYANSAPDSLIRHNGDRKLTQLLRNYYGKG